MYMRSLVEKKRVLVTGATGFLGSALCTWLNEQGASTVGLSSQDCDLRDANQTMEQFARIQPDIVFHCAVQGGGIGWMKDHPVDSGLDNYRINLNVLDAAFNVGAQSFVGVSSACVYPKHGQIPYDEAAVWGGYPEPFNGPYALSKRAMMDMGKAYSKQYGFHCVFPILANLYGPGDHLSPERAHVIADLMLRAKSSRTELSVWGTGTAEREFLFIDDAIEGIVSTLRGQAGGFYNVGTGISTPIHELAQLMIDIINPELNLVFDETKPDGQLLKVMKVSKMATECGWTARTLLRDGLERTWMWYSTQMGV